MSGKLNKLIYILANTLLAIGATALFLGALLLKASYSTGANSDYSVPVSWGSAFASVLWPLYRFPVHYILIATVPVILAWLAFFHLPRFAGVPLLLVQVLVSWKWYQAGGLGLFFLLRELETYKFQIDGERLGEQWFTFEAVAVWMLVTGFLAFLRLPFRSTQTKLAAHPQTPQGSDHLPVGHATIERD